MFTSFKVFLYSLYLMFEFLCFSATRCHSNLIFSIQMLMSTKERVDFEDRGSLQPCTCLMCIWVMLWRPTTSTVSASKWAQTHIRDFFIVTWQITALRVLPLTEIGALKQAWTRICPSDLYTLLLLYLTYMEILLECHQLCEAVEHMLHGVNYVICVRCHLCPCSI